MLQLAVFTVLVATLVGADRVHVYPNGFRRVWPDFLLGPYCATRADPQCCESRDDDCSLPMYGTRCYCDQFCDKEAFDCCPDFFEVCRPDTIKDPECVVGGRTFRIGQTYMDNCNECTCRRDGKSARIDCTRDVCLMRPEFVQRHNRGRTTWRALDYSTSLSKFSGKTLVYGVEHFTGVKDPKAKSHVVKWHTNQDINELRRRREFDLRQLNSVSRILDQGYCNSSWAHGVAAHVSDKIMYAQRRSAEKLNWEMSPQYLIDCYDRDEDGCEGGLVDRAHNYLNTIRGVSNQCYGGWPRRSCPFGINRLPERISECPDRASNQRDTVEISSTYVVYSESEVFIKGEILDRGSVLAIMKVYSDFYMYKDGIYEHDRQNSDPYNEHPVGHIAVRILGWGEEDGVPYWICANNWGTNWGENGFFRILREAQGHGESDITKFVRSFGTVNIGSLQVSENIMKRRQRNKQRKRRLRHKH